MVQEEVLGKPLRYGTPAAAIEAMTTRLNLLRKQKADALSALEECEDDKSRKALLGDLITLNNEIDATRSRLDSYRFQK